MDSTSIPEFSDLPSFFVDLRVCCFRFQTQAADHLGCHPSQISRYESGQSHPPLEYLASLALLAAQRLEPQIEPSYLREKILQAINNAIEASYPERDFLPTWMDLEPCATNLQSVRTVRTHIQSVRRDHAALSLHPHPLRPSSLKLSSQGIDVYFSGRDEFLTKLTHWIESPQPNKKLAIVHGIGGVGKSSLLTMLYVRCQERGTAVAITSGDEVASVVEVLESWQETLQGTGSTIRLSRFTPLVEKYHRLQILSRREESQLVHTSSSEHFPASSAAHNTPETIADEHPQLQPIETTAGDSIGILIGRLAKTLSQEDIDLLLDPIPYLTRAFTSDLAVETQNQRIVLMIDTYERLESLNVWASQFVRDLPANALVVIAGRKLIDWDNYWAGWLTKTEMYRLRPMDAGSLHTLIERYYTSQTGEVLKAEDEGKIVRFARGLPLAAVTAVRLLISYGLEDLDMIEAEALQTLVKRMRSDVSSKLVPILDAVAILRYFNKSILRTLTDITDVDDAYDELRTFPFVRPGTVNGRPVLHIHDSVREFLDQALLLDDPMRYRELHKRAAVYYENQMLEKQWLTVLDEEAQQLALESAYHRLRHDEDAGMDFVHNLFRIALDYARFPFCDELMNEARPLPLNKRRNQQRLSAEEALLTEAQFSLGFIEQSKINRLISNSHFDPMSQWEVVCLVDRYAEFCQDLVMLHQNKSRLRALLEAKEQLDVKARCTVAARLAEVTYIDDSTLVEELTRELIELSQHRQEFQSVQGYWVLSEHFLRQGLLLEAESAMDMAVRLTRNHNNLPFLANMLNRSALPLIGMKKTDEALTALQEAWRIAEQLPSSLSGNSRLKSYILRTQGIYHHEQGNYGGAIDYYWRSLDFYRKSRSIQGRFRTLILLTACLHMAGRRKKIAELYEELMEISSSNGNNEPQAGWFCLLGHLAIDSYGGDNIDPIVSAYADSLRIGLAAHIYVLDEILNRIFWGLERAHEDLRAALSNSILHALREFWLTTQLEQRSLPDIELEKRQRFFPNRENHEDHMIITRLDKALNEGIPSHKPSHFLSF